MQPSTALVHVPVIELTELDIGYDPRSLTLERLHRAVLTCAEPDVRALLQREIERRRQLRERMHRVAE